MQTLFPYFLLGEDIPSTNRRSNKADLNEERQVMKSEGEQLAQQWGIPFFETRLAMQFYNQKCLNSTLQNIFCKVEFRHF